MLGKLWKTENSLAAQGFSAFQISRFRVEKRPKRGGKSVDYFGGLRKRFQKLPRSRRFLFSTIFSTTFSPTFAVEKWKTLQKSCFFSLFPHAGCCTFSTSNSLCFPSLLLRPLGIICGEFLTFPHTFQHLWKTCGEVGDFRVEGGSFVACGRRPRLRALDGRHLLKKVDENFF